MRSNFFGLLKKNKKDKVTILEDLLFGTCIVSFLILVSIQAALLIPSVRDTFNLGDKSIGEPLSKDNYLYKQGQITLKMIGNEPDPTVKILVNGETVAIFENLIMKVNVNDGDVIEIDGSHSLIGHIVMVDSVSENISSECSTAAAKVNSNIQKLVKVQIY
ncbi:hypothetical protein EHE19_010240 [Ruminiclostridium herbifermentans]|uniref:Uncharacterized protein n=1 Tax=Ruminiclostridium herbifermentans TaxID=2488810 RepID=A0A4U7JKL0_9FIRM|nr:hypothetical protein [Ruminiclostridium herbifermentans]QNU65320.1 hypothetical protein EHE19_010240 [Ruminiclostridium herbifermentans]